MCHKTQIKRVPDTLPTWTSLSPLSPDPVSQWALTEVSDRAKDLILHLSGKRALKRFEIAEVNWGLRGLCAGQALVNPMRIRLNSALLSMPANRYVALRDTVLHEAAHLAAMAIHPKEGRGHGPLWTDLAIRLGCKPERCHTLPLKRHRVLREYAYELAGRTIWLGPRQHAALQRGVRYLCRHTGDRIRARHFTGEVREER